MAVDAARPTGADGTGSWGATALVALLAASLAGLPALLRPGHYFQDDMQSQYVPLFVELGRSWARGELPLLTDGTWSGGALAGEYQHGVFSLVHVVLALIAHALSASPAAIALGLTMTYVGIAAGGAHRLALHHRVGAGLALCVALAASLNGFNVHFGSWLPALTGFAWLPWACWGAARTLEGEKHARPWLSFFVYGLLSAGWHFAALMLALWLSYLLAFEPGPRGRGAAVLALAPPLAVGTLLAAPSLLCFFELARVSARRDLSAPSWAWTVPPSALVGLLLPRAVGEWSVFGSPIEWPHVVMSSGSLTLLVLPGAWARASADERRRLAPLLLSSAFVLLLAATPNLTAARWPFRWLPLFHLSLTLAVARAVAPWTRAPRSPRLTLLSPLALAVPASALVLATQPSSMLLLLNVALVAAGAAALTWAERTPSRLPAVLAVGMACNLFFTPLSGPPRDVLPRWDTQACFRDAPGRGQRHLGVFGLRQIVGERRFPDERRLSPGSCFFPGDSGLLSERPTASGYSLLFASGVGQVLEFGVHGELGARQIEQVAGAWSEPGSLLDRWGIEVLLVPSFWEKGVRGLVDHGWRVESRQRDVLLLMRPPEQRAPAALLTEFHPARVVRGVVEAREWLLRSGGHLPVYATDSAPKIAMGPPPAASLQLVSASQSRVTARVTVDPGPSPALIRLLRPHLPGQRATLNGTPLPLGRADGAFVVAEVPAGSRGELRFDYQPLGVRAPGIVALALGLIGLGWLTLRAQREQKPS